MIDYEMVRTKCQGLLAPKVYEKIYQTAFANEGPIFLEIGTFFAATTVCLARAVKDSGKKTKIYTIEKAVDRVKYNIGGVDENYARIRENLAYFEVDDVVEVLMGDSEICASKIPSEDKIGLLFVDADGRLDRDMKVYYDRLADDADVMFDDINDEILVWRREDSEGSGLFRVDAKHKISFELLKILRNHELISEGEVLDNTYFGKKLQNSYANLPMDEVLQAYRGLVLADATLKRTTLKKRIKSALPPGVLYWLRQAGVGGERSR